MPIRPFRLARDFLHPGPGEAVAADADAVADRAPSTQHVIEISVRGIDDQRSRRLLGREGDFLPAQVRRKLRRPNLRLFFRRQRRQHHRPAVGAHRRLHRSGDGTRRPDCLGRTQGAIVFIGIEARSGNAAIDVAAIRIDHRRRAVGTAITRIIGRKDRTGRRATVGIHRRSTLGPAIARIIRRKDRTSRWATVGINRRSTRGAAIARIIR